jgi:hypothetical protein
MKPKKWTREDLALAVKNSRSVRQVLNSLGLAEAGGNYKQIKKYIQEWGIEIGHFLGQGWNKGLQQKIKAITPIEDILVDCSNFQSYKLKKRLFKEGLKKQSCEECGWHIISEDGRLPLELHHINGDSKDNRLENLQILCPNCHSLKSNHRGLNIK